MAKYVYLYKGGSIPQNEEEQKQVMDAWTSWFGTLGNSVLDMGNPLGPSKGVGGGSTSGITGYSIVEAADFNEAVEIGERCPIFDEDGSVEIARLTMPLS